MDPLIVKLLGVAYILLGPFFVFFYFCAVILIYVEAVKHEKKKTWPSLMWSAFKYTSILMLLVAPVGVGEFFDALPWWLFVLGQPHTGAVTIHMALQFVAIILGVYIFFLLLLFAINRGIISNKDKG